MLNVPLGSVEFVSFKKVYVRLVNLRELRDRFNKRTYGQVSLVRNLVQQTADGDAVVLRAGWSSGKVVERLDAVRGDELDTIFRECSSLR